MGEPVTLPQFNRLIGIPSLQADGGRAFGEAFLDQFRRQQDPLVPLLMDGGPMVEKKLAGASVAQLDSGFGKHDEGGLVHLFYLVAGQHLQMYHLCVLS
jgi:hypothetical protein